VCGICGFVGNGVAPAEASIGAAMRDTLVHRGPDGEGERILTRADGEPAGWFGHRRLKIIDLTDAAHQPMASDDGLVVLNYNGEVYNFRELRRELEHDGFRFRSSGDTEVVLRAYEAWGEDFVSRLDGMFAIAVWDSRTGRLTLARDRTGKKPLFYVHQGERLTYASEIKAILAAPWVRVEPDFSRLAEFLTYGYVPHPRTLYKDVLQVSPGMVVTYDGRSLKSRTYWDAQPEPGEEAGRAADPSATIAQLLREATRRRMVADVPLGALLSGGIDSSLVVALMAEVSSEPVHTFTIGFPEEPSYDERRYARLVAQRFSTRHTEFPVRVDAVNLIDDLLWYHDQPYADSSAIPTYLVTKLAHEYVTVALNGDGGDEVFGGYDRFVAAAIASSAPAVLTRAARAGVRLVPRGHGYYDVRRRLERFAELGGAPVRERYFGWISVLDRALLNDLLLSPWWSEVAGVSASFDAYGDVVADLPLLDQLLYANFKTYLPDDLCVKMDRMSMANSLETRSPFLDTALVEYAFTLPGRRKIGIRQLKPQLRHAFRSLLPDEIWRRRKHGFGVPVNRWFRAELGSLFEDEVLGRDSRTQDVLNVDVLQRLWAAHKLKKADHGARLWTVLMLERWLRSLAQPRASAPRADVFVA
jgi:asparagine synthase (glutamine-hydrolysing)